jgi:hypothetical protein
MPTPALRAQLADQDLALRQRHRVHARRSLPDPSATARAIAVASCKVEAGLRSASRLERGLPSQPLAGRRRPCGAGLAGLP